MDRKQFQMPYKYFRCAATRELERTQPDMANPDKHFKALLWKTPDGGESYLLNLKNRSLFKRNGKLKPPYHSMDLIENMYDGQDAFVFCPGPSMDSVDLRAFEGKLTIAVNSAGFKFNSLLWAMFESNYMLWVVKQKIPLDRVYVMTARCAIRWRDMFRKTGISQAIFVPRFEELRIMPHRTPAVGTMGALATAWWLGASRVFIIGMDLSRPGDKPYTSGVPFSQYGATNPFGEQIRALQQFAMPGLEVLNGSPHSQKLVPFTPISYLEIEDIARSAPCVESPISRLSTSKGSREQKQNPSSCTTISTDSKNTTLEIKAP